MGFQIYWPSSFLCLLCFIFVILVKIQLSLACTIQPFSCGNVTADYPFWPEGKQEFCAPYYSMLHCEEHGTATVMINNTAYQVLSIDEENQLLKIARVDYLKHGICPLELGNTPIDPSLFDYSSTKNLTLRYCTGPPGSPKCFPYDAIDNYTDGWIYRKDMPRPPCKDNIIVNVLVPAEKEIHSTFQLEEALKQGIEVKWMLPGGFNCSKCRKSEGFCGYYGDKFKPVCYCNGYISDTDCSATGAHLCFKGC